MRRPSALVFPLNGIPGLQAARVLAARGVPVVGISGYARSPFIRTRVCSEVIHADPDAEELIDTLLRLAPRFYEPPVLVPCSDASVLLLSRNRQVLSPSYRIALPAHETVELLIDKSRFYAWAAANGFDVPRTRLLSADDEPAAALAELRLPVIVKPHVRTRKWVRAGRPKLFRVDTEAELVALHARLKHVAETLLLQEWIEGAESDLYSVNCYYDASSAPLVTFVSRKLRAWPPLAGMSTLGEEVRNDDALAVALTLFGAVSFHGLGHVELKLDPRDGRYVIIEPNIGRPTGRSTTAERAGVELLGTMYCDLVGLPLPAAREQRYRGTRWIYFRLDLRAAFHLWRQGELTLRAWLASLREVDVDAVFSLTDPLPFVLDLLRPVWSLRRVARRSLRGRARR